MFKLFINLFVLVLIGIADGQRTLHPSAGPLTTPGNLPPNSPSNGNTPSNPNQPSNPNSQVATNSTMNSTQPPSAAPQNSTMQPSTVQQNSTTMPPSPSLTSTVSHNSTLSTSAAPQNSTMPPSTVPQNSTQQPEKTSPTREHHEREHHHQRRHQKHQESDSKKNIINLNLGLSNKLEAIVNGRAEKNHLRKGGLISPRFNHKRHGRRLGKKHSNRREKSEQNHDEGIKKWCQNVDSINQEEMLFHLNASIQFIIENFSASSQNRTTNDSNTSYLWDLMPELKRKFILSSLNLDFTHLEWSSIPDSVKDILLNLNDYQRNVDDKLLKIVIGIMSPIRFNWVVNVTEVKDFLKEKLDTDFSEVINVLLDEQHSANSDNSSSEFINFLNLIRNLRKLIKCRLIEKKSHMIHPFVHHLDNTKNDKHNTFNRGFSHRPHHIRHHHHSDSHSGSYSNKRHWYPDSYSHSHSGGSSSDDWYTSGYRSSGSGSLSRENSYRDPYPNWGTGLKRRHHGDSNSYSNSNERRHWHPRHGSHSGSWSNERHSYPASHSGSYSNERRQWNPNSYSSSESNSYSHEFDKKPNGFMVRGRRSN